MSAMSPRRPRRQSGTPDGWLILDVDDTLVDTHTVGFRKCRQVAAELRLPSLSAAAFDDAYGRLSFYDCVRAWYPTTDVDVFLNRYDRLAPDHPPQPLCDGPRLVAAARDTGLGIGVLTNGPGIKTVHKLAAIGLDEADFDFVCHADNWPVAKPAPEAFARLRMFGVDPASSWYVSDAAADWAGSEAAGFRTIGISMCAATASRARSAPPHLALSDAGLLADTLAVVAAAPRGVRRPGMPRAMSFDAGFTLIDDRVDAAHLVARFLRAQSVDVELAEVERAFAASRHWLADSSIWAHDATIDRALGSFYGEVISHLGHAGAALASEVIRQYTDAASWKARPDALSALLLARDAGLRIGVFSNWQSSLEQVLTATGLRTAVDVVTSSAVLGIAKPSLDAFRAVAGTMGVSVGNLVYVGDDPRTDAAPILALGGRAALVPRVAQRETLEAVVTTMLPTEPRAVTACSSEPAAERG